MLKCLPEITTVDYPQQQDHPILNQPSIKVVFPLNQEARQTISDMLETAKKLEDMAGLAAPQIGKNLNIFIHPISDDGTLSDRIIIVINPKIISYSEEKEKGDESCFSIPGWKGEVLRSKTLIVVYYDSEGNKIEKEISNPFLARVFQHETDHLDGILYTQRMEFTDQLRPLIEAGS